MRNQDIRRKTTVILIMLSLGVVFASVGYAKNEIEFVPGEESGFFYIIQKGDTLWDLSQKFYNSNWDWPALWEMNAEIKNPHWIYPGRKIRIFFKDEDKKLKPIIVTVKKMPPKPPEKLVPSFSFSNMDRVGFVRQDRQPELGSIIREKEGNLIISKDDIIYIKPSGNGSLIPGKHYHVYSTSEVEEKIQDKPFKGVKHLIKAKIKVLEHHGNYVSALMVESYRAVKNNDLIMDYYERDEILTVEETPPQIDARIICSEDDNQMINDYFIAFINKGKNEVNPGEMYTVTQKNQTTDYSGWSPKKKEKIVLEDIQAGRLIVLHTEDIASTVMILSSKYAIRPNDMVN